MRKNYKKLAVLIAIMLLTLSLASTGFAANAMKTLNAYYRDIKIFKNGQQVYFSNEPFIVDGTTYVPVRDVSQLLDKEVTWDGANYRIGINDRPGSDVNSLLTQITTQQQTINQLQVQVKNLQAQLDAKGYDIDEMEDYLNDEYGKYNKIDFDIELYETKDKIDVRIYMDSYYDGSYWDALSSTKIKTYLQDIVDDIREEFKDSKITGFIEDIDIDKKLITFTVSTKGVVSVTTTSSSSSGSLYDLEDDLYYEFRGDYGIVDFEVTGDRYEIDVVVYVDREVWGNITRKTSAKNEILNFIYDEYPNADVYGEIRDDNDNKLLDSF